MYHKFKKKKKKTKSQFVFLQSLRGVLEFHLESTWAWYEVTVQVSTTVSAVDLLLFQVEFSSLDFLLHTKALLSTISYLNSAVPQLSTGRDHDAKKQVEKAGAPPSGESQLSACR